MPTSTAIAITCFTALLLLNLILPGIQSEIEGETTTYDLGVDDEINSELTKLNETKPNPITGTWGFLSSVWGVIVAIFKIIIWNPDFNIYVNIIMTVLKVALYISVVEIILP